MDLIVIAPMEQIRLEHCWTQEYQTNFKMADIFGFLRLSQNLPQLDLELVKEYMVNYDPDEGFISVKDSSR